MKRLCILSCLVGILLMGCSPSVDDTKPAPDTIDKAEAVSDSSPKTEAATVEESSVVETESSILVDTDFTFDDKIFSFGELSLVNAIFNEDSVQMEEVRDWAGKNLDDNTVYTLSNLINYYDAYSMMSYVSIWDSSETSMKNALAVFVGKGVVSRDSFEKAGADTEELDKILEDLGYNDK